MALPWIGKVLFRFVIVLFLPVFFLAGCNSKLKKLCVGDKTLRVEIAEKQKDREKGLMNRESLKKNTGMLFIFKKEGIRAFWMKNTKIPLSIAYFTEGKELINIHKMRPAPDSQPFPVTYESFAPAKYALETNWGWFEKNNIKKGAKLDFCQ